MSEPSVCAVMLKNGRDWMARRAVESFKRQTYRNKRLLIWDTGELNQDFDTTQEGDGLIAHVPAEAYRDLTIGALRNEANGFWNAYEVIVHWDSDDWSHPNRIAEQVALLQASGKECIGYNDMLFWRGPSIVVHPATALLKGMAQLASAPSKATETQPGEAYLYKGSRPDSLLGTSLCYWRRAWEAHPFPDLPKHDTAGLVRTGEDFAWLAGVSRAGAPSLTTIGKREPEYMPIEPRMVASIHEENRKWYDLALMDKQSFGRVTQWDQYCALVMAPK